MQSYRLSGIRFKIGTHNWKVNICTAARKNMSVFAEQLVLKWDTNIDQACIRSSFIISVSLGCSCYSIENIIVV